MLGGRVKSSIKLLLKVSRLPGYRRLQQYFGSRPCNPFLKFAAAGHFYSPIPELLEVERDRERIYPEPTPRTLPGIETCELAQRHLLDEFAEYLADCPFVGEQPARRYSPNNTFFSIASAVLLHGVLRHFRPQRIVEVGSGYSSAVMLDTNEFCQLGIEEFTFIDPYPERLQSLLTENDRKYCRVINQGVQSVPNSVFESLQENDLLFIDSSHVAKTGSDVVHLMTKIIPMLRPGVVVHVHDIYWPFEYPLAWLRQGIAWNEAYLLHAFLLLNSEFKIVLFNDFCFKHLPEQLKKCLPAFDDAGSSLYFRRVINNS